MTVGNVVVSQTVNILALLAPRYGLVPTDEALRAEASHIQLTIADFLGEVHDVHHPIAGSLYYYLRSKRRLPFNQAGIFRHYPEPDTQRVRRRR